MFPRVHRWQLALFALGLLLVVAGCMDSDERKPVPIVTVEVLREPEAYRYNGQRVSKKQLDEELRLLAEQHARERMGSARVIVRLRTEPGADYTRTTALQDQCIGLGLNKLETAGN